MFEILPRSDNAILLALASVSCGEPLEICTELDQIDLNEFITNGKNGVYLIRAIGDSMEFEIRRGDFLIVDRNLQANKGDSVIAVVNGDFIVKDFTPKRNGLHLVPKNKDYPTIIISEKDECEIFGVIVGIIRFGFQKNLSPKFHR